MDKKEMSELFIALCKEIIREKDIIFNFANIIDIYSAHSKQELASFYNNQENKYYITLATEKIKNKYYQFSSLQVELYDYGLDYLLENTTFVPRCLYFLLLVAFVLCIDSTKIPLWKSNYRSFELENIEQLEQFDDGYLVFRGQSEVTWQLW